MKNPDMNHRVRYPLMAKSTAMMLEGPALVASSIATIDMDTNAVNRLIKEPSEVTITFNIPQGFDMDWYTFSLVLEKMQDQYLRAVGEKT